jgi:F-type H+-transporting ATPase subunit delta
MSQSAVKNKSDIRHFARRFYPLIEKKFDESVKNLYFITGIFFGSAELLKFLEHPSITGAQKKAVLLEIFKGRIPQETKELCFILIDRKKIKLLPYIIGELEKIHNEETNSQEVTVRTASALSPEEQNFLTDSISETTKKNTVLKFLVDEKLIAGLSINMGNKVIDNNLRSEIRKLREQLTSDYSKR